MHKRKYLFTNDLMKEAQVLGSITQCIGLLALALLIFYIQMYYNVDDVVKSARIVQVSGSSEEQSKNQNAIANFLIWGSDRTALMIIFPYLDCIAFTGLILLGAAYRRSMELFQLWLISAILFCMADMILIIPSVVYAQNKFVILASYILSCVRKLYVIWVVKEILVGLRAEAESMRVEENDLENSSMKRY